MQTTLIFIRLDAFFAFNNNFTPFFFSLLFFFFFLQIRISLLFYPILCEQIKAPTVLHLKVLCLSQDYIYIYIEQIKVLTVLHFKVSDDIFREGFDPKSIQSNLQKQFLPFMSYLSSFFFFF